MEEFNVMYRALRNWDKVQQARGYENVSFVMDEEHILDELSWPLPEFQTFFVWALNQPGLHLPYMQLEGRVKVQHIENSRVPLESGSVLYAPVLTVFSHSEKFSKEFDPAHGVSVRTTDSLGVGDMRIVIQKFQNFLKQHKDAKVVHLNLLVYSQVTSYSEKFILDYFAKLKRSRKRTIITTMFSMETDLHWFLLDHKLILEHRILSSAEVDAKLKSRGIKVDQLPHLLTSDPVTKTLGLIPGMIVEVRVPLESTEDYIYRTVVDREQQVLDSDVLEDQMTEETS